MIYAFNTKPASSIFIKAFIKNFKNKYFDFKKIPGEVRYDIDWPEWNGDIPEGVEVAFQGILRNTHKIKDICKRLNRKFYYFDHPFFFASHYKPHPILKDLSYRIIVNEVQKSWLDTDDKHKKRYENILKQTNSPDELILKDWRTKGDHILVVPPTYYTSRWFNIDRHKWTSDVIRELKTFTDREIRVRYKFVNNVDFGDMIKKPLKEDLKDCWAIVTFHSLCSIEALMNGVPSFTSSYSPAAPISYGLEKLHLIEQPLMIEREKWLYSLWGSQFSLSEMNSGYAYKYLNNKE